MGGRIISLAPSNTEILYALGLQDRIVAVTNLCDYPPEARSKPRVGTWTHTDVDEIARLKPDLIFTSYFLPRELENYEGPGKIIHLEPTGLADIMETIAIIGHYTNKDKQAEQLICRMKTEIEHLRMKAESTPVRPRVYTEEWFNPIMSAGNWVPELIELAGGSDTLVKAGERGRKVSEAEVRSYNPEVIITHWCGTRGKETLERIYERKGWEDVTAIQEHHVFSVDDNLLNRPGPRVLEGARKLYDIFSQV